MIHPVPVPICRDFNLNPELWGRANEFLLVKSKSGFYGGEEKFYNGEISLGVEAILDAKD